MKSKTRNLPVSYTINNRFEAEDSRFLAITIDVLHTGLNYNGSIFNKDIVNASAETIKNTPILGYLALNDEGELDFQGHEYELIKTDDGNQYVYAGSAYGVVPESCDYRWVEKVSSDGETREYFQVDALLWTKFEDAVSVFEQDGSKPQSMELKLESIEGEEQEDGTFVFTSFSFDGCCLLSSTDDSIQPAMIDSVAVANYSAQSIAMQIKNKLDEYSKLTSKETDKKIEGGSSVAKKNEKDFSLNIMEKIDEVRAVLSQRKYKDSYDWEYSQYYLQDIQEDEVIAVDRADNYRIYGLKYSADGDSISIDFDSAKRKKTTYVDFQSSDTQLDTFATIVSDVAGHLTEKVNTVTVDKEKVESEFATLKADYDEIKPKYDNYVVEAEARQKEAIETSKTAEFNRFDDTLKDNTDYAELKANRDNYTLEEIQNKCAILFTETNLNVNFSKKNADSMTSEVFESEPDVEVNSRYGVLPMKD